MGGKKAEFKKTGTSCRAHYSQAQLSREMEMNHQVRMNYLSKEKKKKALIGRTGGPNVIEAAVFLLGEEIFPKQKRGGDLV